MPIVIDPGIGAPPIATSATSADGYLVAFLDSVHAGVLLQADFSSLATDPIKVRFYRDGILVRSGDPAWAPGGIAYAYDHEAPLDATCAWTAVPIFADGTSGAESLAAALATPEMDAAVDCWVKPLNNPGLSVAFPIHSDRVEMGWSARVQSYSVPGRSLATGTFDRRTPNTVSITLRTKTRTEKDDLNAALDAGPVFVQLRSTFGIADFYAIPGDSTERFFLGMFSQLRDIPTGFLPCDRPPTIDAPLFIPGHSYGDQMILAPTYAERLAAWPLHEDALLYTGGPGELVEGSGSGGGGAP